MGFSDGLQTWNSFTFLYHFFTPWVEQARAAAFLRKLRQWPMHPSITAAVTYSILFLRFSFVSLKTERTIGGSLKLTRLCHRYWQLACGTWLWQGFLSMTPHFYWVGQTMAAGEMPPVRLPRDSSCSGFVLAIFSSWCNIRHWLWHHTSLTDDLTWAASPLAMVRQCLAGGSNKLWAEFSPSHRESTRAAGRCWGMQSSDPLVQFISFMPVTLQWPGVKTVKLSKSQNGLFPEGSWSC